MFASFGHNNYARESIVYALNLFIWSSSNVR